MNLQSVDGANLRHPYVTVSSMFVVTERDSCQEPDARQEDLLHDLGPCITFGRGSPGSPHRSFLFWIGVQLTEERYKFLRVCCF
jgi:hypothetical protein